MSDDNVPKGTAEADIEAEGSDSNQLNSSSFRGQLRRTSETSLTQLVTSITKFKNYWTKLAQNDRANSIEEPRGKKLSLFDAVGVCCASQIYKTMANFRIAFSDVKIALITILTFLVLCATGISVILVFANEHATSERNLAVEMAKEMGYQIQREMNRGLLPLFTMEEIVRQISAFDNLPIEMNETASYPNAQGRAFRNATDLCLDQRYTTPFSKVARSIKDSSKMEKILVNIQLAPLGALCLSYPLINTEDFEEGIIMNNTGAIGLDIINDPINGYLALQAIKNGNVTIQGPLKLIQGGVPVVKEALIARNPVYIEGYQHITIDGKDYPFWGFTTVLLNWDQLKKKSRLHEFYAERGMDFIMKRTDTLIDANTRTEFKKTVVITESSNSGGLDQTNSVSVPLKYTDNEWELIVGYSDGFDAPWKTWTCVIAVIFSLLVASGVMTTLVEKKKHELLLYRMMPKEAVRRLHQNGAVIEKYDLATICIIDIVSFTSIADKLRPEEIFTLLKELYTKFDAIAKKHGVFNVETIGDSYVVTGGGPENCLGKKGAEKVAMFALECVEAVRHYDSHDGSSVQVRVGIASGLVIAGVVGTSMPKFTLFGDTVTLASTVETTSKPMMIQCTSLTERLLQDSDNFTFLLKERKDGKLPHATWWIKGSSKKSRKKRPPRNSKSKEDASLNCSPKESHHDGVNDHMVSDKSWDLIRYAGGMEMPYDVSTNLVSANSVDESLDGVMLESPSSSRSEASSSSEDSDLVSIIGSKSKEEALSDLASVYSKDSAAFHNYWSRLAKTNAAWGEDDEEESVSILERYCRFFRCTALRHMAKATIKEKKILIVGIVVFASILITGISLILVLSSKQREESMQKAVDTAIDFDHRMSDELFKALLPVYALTELVKQLTIFDDIPEKALNSSSYEKNGMLFRNVTDIWSNVSYATKFSSIASSIKREARMKYILVNIQLAPAGIVSLVYPEVNEEDFPEGYSLDSRSARGHDLPNDPKNIFYVRKAIKGKKTTIQGPLTLMQAGAPIVREALIVRNPIYKDNLSFPIDGSSYPFWGFATVILNWESLKRKLEIEEFFSSRGFDYSLTRSDTLLNLTTNQEFTEEIAIIKPSKNAMAHTENSISHKISFTDNEWVLTLYYKDLTKVSPWVSWSCFGVVMVAFFAFFLVITVMVAKSDHEALLYRMMPRDVTSRLQQGKVVVETLPNATIFFSHVIGFTKLSGAMRPSEFMKMLNQIYDEFDRLAVKHKVHKIEVIGDAYIVIGGRKNCSDVEGAKRAANFALDALNFVDKFRYKNMRIFIRTGLSSGPIVSGVVGASIPKFTIFGNSVNVASRMESTGKSMKIQCSKTTFDLLSASSSCEYDLEKRSEDGNSGITVKGKGLMQTW
eukprot:CAMPEP_0194221944 /NCGR_PEP_ID=MMETSP0156-20130528/31678_1 /TAXON_ID=33649 /ORGANISM="Thalassionema nitzschioides, Strain L26-B" /LENGTH=1383 /DNA_ID=CAMNT_0038952517 /DNA_START=78 /DNA_END=4226 /DNA_ORIENTATION=+